MASGGEELESLQNIGKGQTFTDNLIKRAEALTPLQQVKKEAEYAPPITKEIVSSHVKSTFDARPINAVDTFGVNPVITAGNVLIAPASAPIVFEYTVNVPNGRTYVLRDFYFIPTRFIYDAFNNPIQDLFHITFFINGSPVSENSNLIFPTWGTGGFVPAFFIAEENAVITIKASITNAAYLDIEPAFNVFIGASISMRFNALLSNAAPKNLQIGNIVDNQNSIGMASKEGGLNGIEFGRRTYKRPE